MLCVVKRSSVQPTTDSPLCDLQTTVMLKGNVGVSSIIGLIIVIHHHIVSVSCQFIDGPHYDLETAV